ncbi:MAG: MotA/TolQ/ExbB proton channel family protein [SAR324 cluster bacterium]|nr:MotA/TolQ/ExbB proton channel family protein [SAR324 cluster bacterium]
MTEQPQNASQRTAEGPPGTFTGKGTTRWFTRRSDNADLLKALFLGIMVTAVFYEVFPLPFIDEQRVTMVFDNWVSEVIVAMTLWSLFILLFKYVQYRQQSTASHAFHHSAIGDVLAGGMTGRNADTVLGGLREVLGQLKVRRYEESIIYRRVARVISYIRRVPHKGGANELLDYQAQIDLKKLDASYTVLHVFIWAIPILGFIGTVLGIADSVREFSGFIQTAEGGVQFSNQMRAALGGVTSGLGIAFNTTFLALVLVIPVMLITSFLQKSEEELLLAVEEFCMEDLLPHLYFSEAADPATESFDDHLRRIQQLSTTWLGQFEPLLKSLSLQVDMVRHQMSGIQPLIKDFTDRLLDGGAGGGEPPQQKAHDEPQSGQGREEDER